MSNRFYRKSNDSVSKRAAKEQKGRSRKTMRFLCVETLESRQLLTTYNVDTPVDENDGDFSVGDLSLREAIENANNNAGSDTITFDATVFGSAQQIDLGSALTIAEAIDIQGPGQGLLTLDGFGFAINDGNNAVHQSVTITDLSIANAVGTGIINFESALIERVSVRDSSGAAGGGILNRRTMRLVDATISGNTAGGGAGIYNNGGNFEIVASVIENNVAFGDGGGINNRNGVMSIVGGTIRNNTATNGGGGGIKVDSNSLTIDSSTISGNVTNSTGNVGGGGIFSDNADVTITHSTINHNEAPTSEGGGIRFLFGKTLAITNSTISSNVADTVGAAISAADGTTIDVVINNSTIAKNSGSHAALFFGGVDPVDLVMQSSIVADNVKTSAIATNFADFDFAIAAPTGSVNFSLIESGESVSGSGNIVGQDPLLGSLTFSGGRNETHALLPGSPAIDAGSNPLGLPVDQRFFPRSFGGGVDIGAYEVPRLIVDTLADVSNGDFSTGDMSLREAIEQANVLPGANTIEIDVVGRIELVAALPNITQDLTIRAIGATLPFIDANGLGRVLTIAAANPTNPVNVTLDRLWLTGGVSSDSGGAISHATGSLNIFATQITDNASSAGSGGAISMGSGTVHVNSTSIVNNTANQNAGAILVADGDLSIVGSHLGGNMANAHGGAIWIDGQLSIMSSLLAGNSTGDRGGAIYAGANSELSLTQTAAENNSTPRDGGSIYNLGELTISDSYFAGNMGASGGAIFQNGSTATIVNSTFSNNSGTANGGAIWLVNANSLFANSTITGNRAAKNGTGGTGGGLSEFGSTTVLNNTIIAGNFRGAIGADIPDDITSTSPVVPPNGFNNLIGDPASAGGMTHGINGNILGDGNGNVLPVASILNPIAAANNVAVSGDLLTHALVPNSPAIDAGNNSKALDVIGNPLGADQRGLTRVQADVVDIGAFEAQPVVYRVDTLLDESDGNFSVGDLSLREAIELANANAGADEIRIDLDGRIELTTSLPTIRDHVTIRGIATNLPTVDANATGRVFTIEALNPSDSIDVTFDRIWLTGGDVNGQGGAIFQNRGDLNVFASQITENAATQDGGAIFVGNGDVYVNNTSIVDNSSGVSGGGISIGDGHLTFNNGSMRENSAGLDGGAIALGNADLTVSNANLRFNSGANGGAIFTGLNSIASIDNVDISNNTANGEGGGIFNLGVLTLTDSELVDNTATEWGGGLAIRLSNSAMVERTTINGNLAEYGGGVSIENNSVAVIRESTISHNDTNAFGGAGIQIRDSDVTIEQSTISGNQSVGSGAGIEVNGYDVTLDISDTTIADNHNTTTGVGAAIAIFDVPSFVPLGGEPPRASVTLTNTLIAENTRDGHNDPDAIFGALEPSSSYVLIDDSSSAGGLTNATNNNLIGVDAGIDIVLSDNGGPTLTHALLAGSLAIDAGSNVNGLTTDQRGLSRPTGNSPDIGAFETQPRTYIVDTLADVSNGNFSAGNFSLREAMEEANSNAGADTILVNVEGIIELTAGLPSITEDVTIRAISPTLPKIDANETGRVFTIQAAVPTNPLDVTIRRMWLTGGDASGDGGAIFHDRGTLNLHSSQVTDNASSQRGGGVYMGNGTVNLNNTTFTANTAGTDGGAILVANGDVSLTNSTLQHNSAAGDGGGVVTMNGTVSGFNATLRQNTATSGDGGAVHASFAPTTLAPNFTGNVATDLIGSNVMLFPDFTNDVGVPGNWPNGSGWDIQDVRLQYVPETDTLFVGINFLGIGGDSDGDGDPSVNTAPGGGTDAANLGDTEAINVRFDINQDGNFDYNVGVPGIIGEDFSSFTLTPTIGSPSAGSDFDLANPVGGAVVATAFGVPTAAAPDFQFSIENFSLLSSVGSIDQFDIEVFAGSFEDTGFGEDFLTVEDIEISGPIAEVFVAVDLTNSAIYDNDASGEGGGVWFDGNLSISDSELYENASQHGGAISAAGGQGELIRTIVRNNNVLGVGGGLRIHGDASVKLDASSVQSNNSDDRGGGIHNGGTLIVVDSLVANNYSDVEGGGIYMHNNAHTSFVNSSLSGNSQERPVGAGLDMLSGSAHFVNSTVTQNRTSVNGAINSGSGAGIQIFGSSRVLLENTIVAQNFQGPEGSSTRDINGTLSANSSNNLIGVDSNAVSLGIAHGVNGNQVGTAALPIDPLLGPLGPNGGPTLTHALLPSSPAIDAGDVAAFANTGAANSDQRGVPYPRVDDGDGNGTATIDIGAFELLVDGDSDMVGGLVEDAAPNSGDGNADGLPDSQQDNVTSIPNLDNSKYVTMVLVETQMMTNVSVEPNPSPNDAPADTVFPEGFFEFTLNNVPAGTATSLTILLESNLDATTYYKFGPTPGNLTPHWYEFLYDGTTGAELLADRIVLHFVDGLRGDDDVTPNGSIQDIGAPAVSTIPKVTQVKVGASLGLSSDWSTAFVNTVDNEGIGYPIPMNGEQLDSLPWGNIRQVFVEFSEDVESVTLDDFALYGVNNQQYNLLNVAYDPTEKLATLTIDGDLGLDKLLLVVRDTITDANDINLDGEWTTGRGGASGDGQPGGDFLFRFNVVPGDINRSGGVAVNDVGPLRGVLGLGVNDDGYSMFADINGSGVIAVNDLGAIRTNLGEQLPLNDPTLPAVPALPLQGFSANDVDAVMQTLLQDDSNHRWHKRSLSDDECVRQLCRRI